MIDNEFDPRLRRLFAENLRRLRTGKSISQEELSAKCGFHRTYVSQVERAKANVSIDNMQKLADALMVSHLELLQLPDAKGKKNEPPSAKQTPSA